MQLPDYELRDAYQKRIGVLEVTSVVASDILSFNASRRKLDFSSDQLRCTWFVVMQSADFSHAELNRLSKVPPPLLIQTEDAGIAPFGPEALVPGFTYNVGDEPTTSLYEAGVKMLNARPGASIKAGEVFLQPPAQGGAIGPTDVTRAAQIALGKEDNLKKLSTAGVGERAELFVWMDEGSASAALTTPRLFPNVASSWPTDGPTLPTPVTRVWAAVGPNDCDVLARGLWVADGGTWEVIASPPRLSL